MTRKPFLLSASSLSGNRVLNAEGEELGTIEEIMLDMHEDRIAYAVLSFGGILASGASSLPYLGQR